MNPSQKLLAIKVAHTLIWLFFVMRDWLYSIFRDNKQNKYFYLDWN